MPFDAKDDGRLDYTGNEVFDPIPDIAQNDQQFIDAVPDRVDQLHDEAHWGDLATVNDLIFDATTDYFDAMGAEYTLLPLTTRLISSPGAVFGSEKIDYTEDTSPITVEWFDEDRNTFLSESSQVYLELALVQQGVDQVYSIYNSFRKEEADFTHLSEFHHIEYEGQVGQNRNEEIVKELVETILDELLTEGREELRTFLSEQEIAELEELRADPFVEITFAEALELLQEETGDDRYEEFTQREFGDWEEVKLTEILDGKIVCVKEYPLLEVPFYHAEQEGREHRVAKNSDFIWPGYKETVGTGERVASIESVEEKAELFNLPREDYQPYIRARKFDDYQTTSGFGVGWERLVQGILKMPSIVSTAQFPRVHNSLKP
jgi:aspartyl/asparaginyl-tRNA synthetase